MPHLPKNQCFVECLQCKFYDIICRVETIGDPDFPACVIRVKAIKQCIVAWQMGLLDQKSLSQCGGMHRELIDAGDEVGIGVYVKSKKNKVLTNKTSKSVKIEDNLK